MDALPPLPVIMACAEALPDGLGVAEQRLVSMGFAYAEESVELSTVEADYDIALNLLHGLPHDYDPQADADLPFGLEPIDEPGLTEGFDNTGPDSSGWLHKVLSNSEGEVVILMDDGAGAGCLLLSSTPWEGFLEFYKETDGDYVEKADSGSVKSIEYMPMMQTYTFWQRLYWSVFPSAYPDTADWSLMHTDMGAFTSALGRTPRFAFSASYDISREY